MTLIEEATVAKKIAERSTEIRYSAEEGLYHVILIFGKGDEADVGAYCEEDEAKEAIRQIRRFAAEF